MILLLATALAQSGSSERSYQRTIDLVEGLYLYPERIDAVAMLREAVDELGEELHWLMVEPQGTAVNLRHGDGTLIGSVSVASVETLPAALSSVEHVVRRSGQPLGEVDIRLELLQGLTNALDRYSRVLAGDGLDRFDVRLKGTLVGVGLTMSIRDDQLAVTHVTADGPAARGGVQVGDRIIRIDGRSTVNMPTSEATRRIRGEPETSVTLTLLREDRELEISLTRAEVVVPNVKSRVLAGDIGYVHISHVSQRTVENLLKELDRLKQKNALAKGLVLDLRGNTGGSMKESARTVDQFVDAGLLLRTAGPDGNQVRNLQARMEADEGGAVPEIPVVVLVDERTASGAEIIAGALLELERTALVGTRSFGKGTVQKIYPLTKDIRLKLTVAQYVLANDRMIADRGLVPDVAVGSIELDSYGVHYEDWDTERIRVQAEDIVPWVQEAWSWREQEQPYLDLVEEIGRRAVLQASGTARSALVSSLQRTAKQIRAEQETHLSEALAAQGIDWSLPEPPPSGKMPRLEVQLSGTPDPERDDVILLSAVVTNHGRVPIHQARVELDSEFRVWDGLVLPIGRLDPGASLTGQVRVGLVPGVNAREDDVTVFARAAGYPRTQLQTVPLHAESTPKPDLSATVALVGEGAKRHARVQVTNHSKQLVEGLEAHFAYPGDVDVELIDRASRIPSLEPGKTHTFDLEVAVGPQAPDRLPLRLVMEADRFGRLARWPVTVPMDGSPVKLAPPEVRAQSRKLSSPTGPLALDLVVTDDVTLDHVVVFHNGRKVAWAPGSPEVELSAEIDVQPGKNRIMVVGIDDQELTTRTQYVVRGIETDDAIAEPTP